jgi:lysyl-tRNA synthetase class 2
MNHLSTQFKLLQGIRNFFNQEGFTDVLTPPMVTQPGMEAHIHPFAITQAKNEEKTPYYLHTSPEFHMKELLSQGMEKIFTLSYCFRDEPESPQHRPQFIMLEWYRAQERYEKIMDDCEKLIPYCLDHLKQQGEETVASSTFTKMEKTTIQEIMQEYLSIDILQFLEEESIRELLVKDFEDIPLPSGELSWDDYFFLLFLNKVEPQLVNHPFLLLYEFPHHLSALSTLKESDPRVCERFEIYLNGIELCNCFNELCDLGIQKKRYQEQNAIKLQNYNYSLPQPNVLFKALEQGLPPSAGIALGVERLQMALVPHIKPFWS